MNECDMNLWVFVKVIHGLKNKFDMKSSAVDCLWYYAGRTWVSCMMVRRCNACYSV